MTLNLVWKWMAMVGAGLVAAWVRLPHTIQILLMVMGLDVISGLMAAFISKKLASGVMLRGLFQKLSVFIVLALLRLIQEPLNLGFDFDALVAVAFIVYEAISIIENCATAGVPIPVALVSALAKAKIKTATAEDIRRQFETNNSTMSVVVHKTSEIIPTEGSSPDLKLEKVLTTVEEQHITPVAPGGQGKADG